ncbi:MAG: NYN domain-containing protein [Nanoarchaeota archaeon]
MDKNFRERERVIVFIDGSNVYHIVKALLPDKKQFCFNFEKMLNYIIGNRNLIRFYYYNAPLDRKKNEESYVKQQRFFDRIAKIQKCNFVLCRMLKRKIGERVIYEVKEDDIRLAVDMVKLAYNDAYDTAVLVSSDGDFVPAIQAVKEIGKNVENIGFENRVSYHLQKESDKFVRLKKEIVESFFN